MPLHRCQYCGKAFKTLRAVNHHTSASKTCYNEWRKNLLRKENPSPKRPKKDSSTELDEIVEQWEENETAIVDDFDMRVPPKTGSVDEDNDDDDDAGNTYPTTEAERFIESYPGDAGKGLRKSKTRFEIWLQNQRCEEKNPWDPFSSKEEWALTMWLIKNVGQKSTDDFLKLPIVSKGYIAFY